MKNLLKIQQKLIPEVIEIMTKRYLVLREISLSGPIGRRALANNLQNSERIIRTETELLKQQGLIDVASKGMTITQEGQQLLKDLKDAMRDVIGINQLQEEIRQYLGIKKVILIPGSYDNNHSLIKDIGSQAAKYFLDIIKDNDIVSIAGGSTMLEFARSIKSDKKYNSITVVPARGSMGLDVETQSNNVVAEVSKNIHSNYKLLNVPDQLCEESIKMLTQEPEIKSTLELIDNSDVLVFGVGRADEMVERRKLSDEIAAHGIKVKYENNTILAGNEKLMKANNIKFESNKEAGTVVYVAVDNKFIGYIVIADKIKKDSEKAIKDIKEQGIKQTVMLTGDNKEVATSVAKKLKLDKVFSNLLPNEKVDRIEELYAGRNEKEKIAFVGDGINDAPVLARVDVGIAMGGLGSDAAIEAADIVIMTDEPSKIAKGIQISKKTYKIVWQNIIFALGIKIIVMLFGAMGMASMWEAVFADVGVAILAVLNAMRIMK
jgi:central glycolytic genes regulator